jgi:hypothetical protein
MSKIEKIKPKKSQAVVPALPFTAEAWMPLICAELEKGYSLHDVCALYPEGPAPETVLSWVQKDRAGVGERYARAREIGYLLLGDRIEQMARETHTYTLVPLLDAEGNQLCDANGHSKTQRVLVPLNSDVIAHKRLLLDTLKWKLSKMLPKVYGDKVTQEHVGAGGGPIAIASVDLKNLSDSELENMQLLMAKAAGSAK